MSEQRDAAFMAIGLLRAARKAWEEANLPIRSMRDSYLDLSASMGKFISNAWSEAEKLPESET